MEAGWSTAYQSIGVGHRDPGRAAKVQDQRTAGLTTAAAAYCSAANDYPRFERQMIRTIFDEGIISGEKQPHPELLRRYPNREHPMDDRTNRPQTGLSGRSGRSNASGRSGRSNASGASRRSAASAAGSAIANSVASSGPPPGYFRQLPTPNMTYAKSSQLIGAGGRQPPEPLKGREVWMLGRGGGQQSSFDSCLVNKGHHIPLIPSS
mmetsp:Transcript_74874/g.167988  ORF Transcript_74874/g.167988 Transcript_74874/m.167988 type:complete len:208 (-) Transcript_74874:63-686(-)